MSNRSCLFCWSHSDQRTTSCEHGYYNTPNQPIPTRETIQRGLERQEESQIEENRFPAAQRMEWRMTSTEDDEESVQSVHEEQEEQFPDSHRDIFAENSPSVREEDDTRGVSVHSDASASTVVISANRGEQAAFSSLANAFVAQTSELRRVRTRNEKVERKLSAKRERIKALKMQIRILKRSAARGAENAWIQPPNGRSSTSSGRRSRLVR